MNKDTTKNEKSSKKDEKIPDKPSSATWARLTSITIKFYYTFVAAPSDEREIMLEEFNNAAAMLKTENVKEVWNELHAAFLAKHLELKEGEK